MGDFPMSARTAYLRAQSTPRSNHQELERERKLLVEFLGEDLVSAPAEQLHQVAIVMGRSPEWQRLVATEARHPGTVGKAVLRSSR